MSAAAAAASPPPRRAAGANNANKLSSPSDQLLSPVSRLLKRKRAPAAAKPALPVVLGSASAGRRSVLARRGLAFDVCVAEIDERAVPGRLGASPGHLALAVARAKADAVKPQLRAPCLLITADQVVLGPDGAPREKPDSPAQARAFLASYAGATARTVSAVVVVNTATGAVAQGVAVETTRFAPALGQSEVLDAALQPAMPVDARGLRATLRGTPPPSVRMVADASGSSAPPPSAPAAAAGGASSSSSSSRRRSARFAPAPCASATAAPQLPTASSAGGVAVSVLATAGAVMIEHPAIAAHVLAVERGDTAPTAAAVGGSGALPVAAAHGRPAGPDDDDDDVVDSVYGLPWRLLQTLVAQAAPGHPWAAAHAS